MSVDICWHMFRICVLNLFYTYFITFVEFFKDHFSRFVCQIVDLYVCLATKVDVIAKLVFVYWFTDVEHSVDLSSSFSHCFSSLVVILGQLLLQFRSLFCVTQFCIPSQEFYFDPAERFYDDSDNVDEQMEADAWNRDVTDIESDVYIRHPGTEAHNCVHDKHQDCFVEVLFVHFGLALKGSNISNYYNWCNYLHGH